MPNEKHVEVVHEGGMAFSAAMSSGHTLRFDGRESNTGGSPVETVLAALAACSAMDVVSIAAKKRQVIERYVVHARARQRAEYPQVFPSIELVHEVEGSAVSEAAIRRCIELSAEKYCPVSAMLSAGATEVHHRYLVRNTGPSPFVAEGEVIVTGPHRRPDVVA